MRPILVVAVLATLGLGLALGPGAAAEDVDRCAAPDDAPVGDAEVCVVDAQEGDRSAACQEAGSGDYEGRTGLSARAGDAPAPDAAAGAEGRHRCHDSTYSYEQEGLHARAETCLDHGPFVCEAGTSTTLEWSQHEVEADGSADPPNDPPSYYFAEWSGFRVVLATTLLEARWDGDGTRGDVDAGDPVGLVFVGVEPAWGGDDGACETQVDALVATPAGYESVEVERGCPQGAPPSPPTGPPASPNPGWGGVTPDLP